MSIARRCEAVTVFTPSLIDWCELRFGHEGPHAIRDGEGHVVGIWPNPESDRPMDVPADSDFDWAMR